MIGSIITVPATNAASFALFLVSTFVVAAGATTLEANCNPYITKLGDEKHESMRLNLAQSFNGVGSIVGPLIMAQILSTTVAAASPASPRPRRPSWQHPWHLHRDRPSCSPSCSPCSSS